MTRNQLTTPDLSRSTSASPAAVIPHQEDDTILLRAMRRASNDRAVRWASYDLPRVSSLKDFPDFAEAAAKRHDLAVERTKVEKELRKAVTDISRGFASRHEEETERQARDILEGRPEEAFGGFEVLKSQVERLQQRVKAYAQAIRKQDEVVATIRAERSIDAAEAMAPTHRAAVAAIAAAIVQLREAFDREEAARTVVVQAGYDDRLPSFATPWLLGVGKLDEIARRAHEYVG